MRLVSVGDLSFEVNEVRDDALVSEVQFDASVHGSGGELLQVPKSTPDGDVRMQALKFIPAFNPPCASIANVSRLSKRSLRFGIDGKG